MRTDSKGTVALAPLPVKAALQVGVMEILPAGLLAVLAAFATLPAWTLLFIPVLCVIGLQGLVTLDRLLTAPLRLIIDSHTVRLRFGNQEVLLDATEIVKITQVERNNRKAIGIWLPAVAVSGAEQVRGNEFTNLKAETLLHVLLVPAYWPGLSQLWRTSNLAELMAWNQRYYEHSIEISKFDLDRPIGEVEKQLQRIAPQARVGERSSSWLRLLLVVPAVLLVLTVARVIPLPLSGQETVLVSVLLWSTLAAGVGLLAAIGYRRA